MSWPAALALGFVAAVVAAIMFFASIMPGEHALAILLIYAFVATWFIAAIIIRGNRL